MEFHILVVDDEKDIADLVELYLTNENFIVHKYYHPIDALKCLENNQIDLAVIDVMMPEMNGFTLCQTIRKKYYFPVIMLTAKESEIDKITGLTIGADDYITKPFRPLELVARIKAQLRRYKRYDANGNTITIFGLVLDIDKHECMLNEKELNLTPIEFSILRYLCENQGKVVSVDELFQEVWKEKYFKNSSNTVMVHIRHLREKMNDNIQNPKYIKTVWGVGYKIEK